ncbi:hypothetical protein J6590_036006 [Homalodisca vitripennis]|nr:hypothetical protein J6590_036006 [Homalodisca vitripennis]
MTTVRADGGQKLTREGASASRHPLKSSLASALLIFGSCAETLEKKYYGLILSKREREKEVGRRLVECPPPTTDPPCPPGRHIVLGSPRPLGEGIHFVLFRLSRYLSHCMTQYATMGEGGAHNSAPTRGGVRRPDASNSSRPLRAKKGRYP